MSRDGITVPGDIRDPKARHYYRTRMEKLCDKSDCFGSMDPFEINTHISPILDQARHIYAQSKRIQESNQYRCKVRSFGLGKFAI